MKEKKNLIVLLPNFKFGGAGNSVFSLINYLKKTDFNISVICVGNCDYKNLFNKKINLYELENKSLFSLFPKIISIVKKIKSDDKNPTTHKRSSALGRLKILPFASHMMTA